MRVDVITLFPEMFDGVLGSSMLKRACDAGHLDVRLHDLRDHSHDKHRKVDDKPFGGGAGMVIRAEPFFAAVEALDLPPACPIILLSPQGRRLDHPTAHALADASRLVLLSGHYEGVDERVREHLVTDEISIGDYVLTCGELPAMVLIDAVARHVPGVLGHEEATQEESFVQGTLEYPHYTRPADFRGWKVPDVLLSGDHARVAAWRREQSEQRTRRRRPDLLKES